MFFVFTLSYVVFFSVFHNAVFGWSVVSIGFIFGHLYAKYSPCNISMKLRLNILLLAPFIFVPYIFLYCKYVDPMKESFLSNMLFFPAVCAFVLIFLVIFQYIKMKNFLMESLGKACLYIFLLHGFIIDLLKEKAFDDLLVLLVLLFSSIAGIMLFFSMKYIKNWRKKC